MNLEGFFQIFAYPFVPRAFAVGIMISLCAALLGVILVLKRYSLIGHALGDVGFASLSLAVAIGVSPIYVSMPIVIISSFIIMAVSQKKGINGDVVIGVVATGALSLGVIISALTNGFNMDVSSFMFGSILTTSRNDVIMSVILAVIVVGMYILFYNRLFLVTCDESFAKASGINVTMYQFIIALLTAITIVIGMEMMGTLLISSLIIFPAITARKLVKSFKEMVIVSAVVSVLCFILGMFLSFALDLPTGASIAMVDILVMVIVMVFAKIRK